jgi:hypothetical protein
VIRCECACVCVCVLYAVGDSDNTVLLPTPPSPHITHGATSTPTPTPHLSRPAVPGKHDFDVSLYVPFLVGRHLDPKYALYRKEGHLRTGFPTYSGPAAWKLFHTVAARIAEVQERCGDIGSSSPGSGGHDGSSATSATTPPPPPAADGGGGGGDGGGGGVNPLVVRFKTTLTYFLQNHPCPYCREHFLSRLSRNDAEWPKLGKIGSAYVI